MLCMEVEIVPAGMKEMGKQGRKSKNHRVIKG